MKVPSPTTIISCALIAVSVPGVIAPDLLALASSLSRPQVLTTTVSLMYVLYALCTLDTTSRLAAQVKDGALAGAVTSVALLTLGGATTQFLVAGTALVICLVLLHK